MKQQVDRGERIRIVKELFEEYGLGNTELLESWEGDDLSELADFLSEEEFQTLTDRLAEPYDDLDT